MDEPLLLHHRDDRGVITLTLNRPQAFNALSESMLAALGEAIDAVAGMTQCVWSCLGLPERRSAPAMT